MGEFGKGVEISREGSANNIATPYGFQLSFFVLGIFTS